MGAVNTIGGMRVYDVQPGQLPTLTISPYGVLSVPAYWRAMRFLSENLASFPRSVCRDGVRLAADEALAHPLTRLLGRRPNGYQTATDFWRAIYFHAAHAGNGYARLQRDAGGVPVALHNWLPERVCPVRYDHGDGSGPTQYYLDAVTREVVPGADVLHLKGMSHDGMAGIDHVCLHAAVFQRADLMGRYQTRYLRKGTVMRGSIEIPTGVTEEKVAQILATLSTYFVGADADRDVMVLSDGATLNNKTLSPQDSQLVQQAAMGTKEIAQVVGVPPQFLYEFSESKYNNAIDAMGEDVVRYTFRPWIVAAQDELTAKLLSADEQDGGLAVRINPDALLRGSTQAVATIATQTVNGGLRTRNEGRALLELPPDPDPESDKLRTLGATTPAATDAPPASDPPAADASAGPTARAA